MRFFCWLFLFTNIFFFMNEAIGGNNPLTIFSKEGNENPIFSPNKRVAVFIRRSRRIIPHECASFSDTGSKYGNEIWIYDFEKKQERLLVANNFDCKNPEKQIIDPKYLQFSPDGKTLYFVTSAWVTSGAVHAVNTDASGLRYVVPGSSLEVIPKGEYKGYLIVNQHRYFLGGGSYDWYWVFSPNGKEEGPLGPEIDKSQKEILESD